MLYCSSESDRANTLAFVKTLSSTYEDFPLRLTEKVCRVFGDDRLVGEYALFSTTFYRNVMYASSEAFSSPTFVDDLGVVPCTMFVCRRQICSSQSSPAEKIEFMMAAFQIIMYVLFILLIQYS